MTTLLKRLKEEGRRLRQQEKRERKLAFRKEQQNDSKQDAEQITASVPKKEF